MRRVTVPNEDGSRKKSHGNHNEKTLLFFYHPISPPPQTIPLSLLVILCHRRCPSHGGALPTRAASAATTYPDCDRTFSCGAITNATFPFTGGDHPPNATRRRSLSPAATTPSTKLTHDFTRPTEFALGNIRFEDLQSEAGKKLLQRSGRAPDDISSVVLVEKDSPFFSLQLKASGSPGYEAYVRDFQRLFVVQTDNSETSSCLGTPAKVKEWNRPLKTLSSQQDHKLMFGLLFSLKSLTAKMDPTSAEKGNLGVPQLPGQGCSFHSFRTNTYKLSFMESPSGIKESTLFSRITHQVNVRMADWESDNRETHFSDYRASTPCPYIMVDDHPGRHDPSRIITHRVQCTIAEFNDCLIKCYTLDVSKKWRELIGGLDKRLPGRSFLINSEQSLIEPYVGRKIFKTIRCGSSLFYGNSMPIRDADMFETITTTSEVLPNV
ncbi:protein phyllo chloroplastic [Phtheirospermum japonicum]|uniref:Protein phyllo chloroplastic n=1 Tax=Phtheirospermum japonicum TaxID=374723 RepID=A0A830DEM1_9LAMI|nr:protein phyllo chloroplastic [Phtheirospermum japonicum]